MLKHMHAKISDLSSKADYEICALTKVSSSAPAKKVKSSTSTSKPNILNFFK